MRKAPVSPSAARLLTCGCCTNGCVCWNHQDNPKGVRTFKCALHRNEVGPNYDTTRERDIDREEK